MFLIVLTLPQSVWRLSLSRYTFSCCINFFAFVVVLLKVKTTAFVGHTCA